MSTDAKILLRVDEQTGQLYIDNQPAALNKISTRDADGIPLIVIPVLERNELKETLFSLAYASDVEAIGQIFDLFPNTARSVAEYWPNVFLEWHTHIKNRTVMQSAANVDREFVSIPQPRSPGSEPQPS